MYHEKRNKKEYFPIKIREDVPRKTRYNQKAVYVVN